MNAAEKATIVVDITWQPLVLVEQMQAI